MGEHSKTLVGKKLSEVSPRLSDTIWRTRIAPTNAGRVRGVEVRMDRVEKRMATIEEKMDGAIKAINRLIKYAQSTKNVSL